MRTEEQKLMQELVMVVLGGKEYEIKPLVLSKAAPWRRKFIALYISSLMSVASSDDPKNLSSAMEDIVLHKPDEIADLFYEYTGFNREEIENSATSKEFQIACEEVIALEAPFFGLAIQAIGGLRKTIR